MEYNEDAITSVKGDDKDAARSGVKQQCPIDFKNDVGKDYGDNKDSSTSDRQCPICFESIADNLELYDAHCCKVSYHKTCWNRWNMESELCPTCRAFHRNPDMYECRECGIRRKCGDYGFGMCGGAWYCQECWDHWWSVMRHLCLEHDDRGVYFRIIAGPGDCPAFAPESRERYASFHRRGVARNWDNSTGTWRQESRQPTHMQFLPGDDEDSRHESPDGRRDQDQQPSDPGPQRSRHASIHGHQGNSSTIWQRSSNSLPQSLSAVNVAQWHVGERAPSIRDNFPYPRNTFRADSTAGPLSSASQPPQTAFAELPHFPFAPFRRNNNFPRRQSRSGAPFDRQSTAPHVTGQWNCNCPYHRGDVVPVTHAPTAPMGERHVRAVSAEDSASHNVGRTTSTSRLRRTRTSHLTRAERAFNASIAAIMSPIEEARTSQFARTFQASIAALASQMEGAQASRFAQAFNINSSARTSPTEEAHSNAHVSRANGVSLYLSAPWHSGVGDTSGTPSTLLYPLPLGTPLHMPIRSIAPQLFAPHLQQ